MVWLAIFLVESAVAMFGIVAHWDSYAKDKQLPIYLEIGSMSEPIHCTIVKFYSEGFQMLCAIFLDDEFLSHYLQNV